MKNNPTPPKTIYFPISLLVGFEEHPQQSSKAIIGYCCRKIAEKKGEEEAKCMFGDYYVTDTPPVQEKGVPFTHFNLEFIKIIADGFVVDSDNLAILLYVCGARSILGTKDYCKTNWQAIASRAAGNVEPIGICERLMNRRFGAKIAELAQQTYKIGYYSKVGIRGFFIYIGTTEHFMNVAKAHITKEVKQTVVTEKNNQATNRLSDDILKQILMPFAARLYIEVTPQLMNYAKENDIFSNPKPDEIMRKLQAYKNGLLQK